MRNGSRNERWLDARITGPTAGMRSRCSRRMESPKWNAGWKAARTIQ